MSSEIKLVEEIHEEQGRRFKVTQKIKVTKTKEKISKRVLERQVLKKTKTKNFIEMETIWLRVDWKSRRRCKYRN
jgi:DNA recombination-dependent growth factor C